MHKNAKNHENHLNPVMLVFIGKLSLSTFRWVPICHGFSHIPAFCHHFMLTKLATSSIRVKTYLMFSPRSASRHCQRWADRRAAAGLMEDWRLLLASLVSAVLTGTPLCGSCLVLTARPAALTHTESAKGKLGTVNHLNMAWTLYSISTVLPWIAWSKFSGEREQQQQVQVRI